MTVGDLRVRPPIRVPWDGYQGSLTVVIHIPGTLLHCRIDIVIGRHYRLERWGEGEHVRDSINYSVSATVNTISN